jgi:GTP 3',8-cyclase
VLEYKDPYCSFSSLKGLTYFEHYKQIMKWMNGNSSYLPPPFECNLDPYAECQLSCRFCNVQRYIKNHREEVGEMRKLPTEYCLRLVDFLSDWGCSALCVSGGGEPTLHDGLPQIINYAYDKELDVSVVTNMVNLSASLIESLTLCRWIAMSVDSSDREMYELVKGKDKFDQVIGNIEWLVKVKQRLNPKVDVAFKMLILEENYKTIFDTCKLAKELGCSTFHVRPTDMEREDIKGHKKQQLDMSFIEEQFEKCHEIEDENFAVFTIIHKFDSNFHNIQRFKRCLATPLLIPVLTDGNWYSCVDVKMNAKYKVGNAFPNPEDILKVWGSDKHRELLKSIVPSRDCSNWRCTFQAYNEQTEKCVLEDRLYRNFP